MSVLGIGTFRFRCPNPAEIRTWYTDHLGLDFDSDGAARFGWTEPTSGRRLVTEFCPVSEAGPSPSSAAFAVRYLVPDVDAAVQHIDANVDPRDGCAWLEDLDGYPVGLCEARDSTAQFSTGPRVAGLGGVFIRSGDVAASKAWYATLGIRPREDGYVVFPAIDPDGQGTFTAWEIFHRETTYFDSGAEGSSSPYMVNLRVRDLDELLAQLREEGVWVDPKTEAYDFGKFAWVRDPLGTRIELWQHLPGD